MTGIQDHNFPAFRAAAQRLLDLGVPYINPADFGVQPDKTWEDYIRRDICALTECDSILLLPGWRQSKGARLEYHIAQALGMPAYDAETFETLVRETICEEADRLVSYDRQNAYGHPLHDFTRIGRLWAPVIGVDSITPEQVALCMVGVKISRECNAPKRDNRTDGCGYFKCLDMIVEEKSK